VLSKLAINATIQERIPEQVRASAFAHSETVLMLAWVLGGATGLIPVNARLGITVATIVLFLAATRGIFAAVSLRAEKLSGVASGDVPPVPAEPERPAKRVPPRARRRRTPAKDRPAGEANRPVPPGEPATEPTARLPAGDATRPASTRVIPREADEPDSPGYHLYRPSGKPPVDEDDE
jgi:hypothetical protein